MAKKLMKGSEAIAEAAIRNGCRFFFGYPINSYRFLLVHCLMTAFQHFFADQMSDRREYHVWIFS